MDVRVRRFRLPPPRKPSPLLKNALRASLFATCVALWLGAPAASALEKRAVFDVDEPAPWNQGSNCTVAYWNHCTGWNWIWSDWTPGDRIATVFDECASFGSILDATYHFVWSAAPCGYGSTNILSVFEADANNCPVGAPLATTPFVPVTGWNTVVWGVPGVDRAAVVMDLFPNAQCGGGRLGPALLTDHPAPGATGPLACGVCYPTTRQAHSFYLGNPTDGALCPAEPLFDGFCNTELLWTAVFSVPVPTENESWSAIKALYR